MTLRRSIGAWAAFACLGFQLIGAPTARADLDIQCDAPWLDQVRLNAVLRVELAALPAPTTEGVSLSLSECTDDAARLAVTFADGATESVTFSLADVAPSARSRALALMLAELLRVGVTPKTGAEEPTEAATTLATPKEAATPEVAEKATAPLEEPARTEPAPAPTESAAAQPAPAQPAPAEQAGPPKDAGVDERRDVGESTPSTPSFRDDLELSLSGGLRVFAMEDTLAWSTRVIGRYGMFFLLGDMAYGQASTFSGVADLLAVTGGVGIRPIALEDDHWQLAPEIFGEIGWVEAQGQSFDPEQQGDYAREIALNGALALVGLRRMGPITVGLRIELGYLYGLEVTEFGESFGGLHGPYGDASLIAGWVLDG